MYTQNQKPGRKKKKATNEAFPDHRPHLCHIQMSTGSISRKDFLAKMGREKRYTNIALLNQNRQLKSGIDFQKIKYSLLRIR